MSPWNWTWEERAPTSSPTTSDAAPPPGARASAGMAPAPPRRAGGPAGSAGRPRIGGPMLPGGGPPDRGVVRRRRAGAAVGLGAILLLVVVASLTGGGSSRRRGHRLAALGGGLAAHASASASALAEARAAQAPTTQEAEAAIGHVLSYTPAVVEGGRRGNEVALTFDDGPGPYTVRLVHTLDRLHVHATFFAIGEMERYFSAGTLAELAAGDAVEDHTETHPPLATLSPRAQREQLFEQAARIEVLGAPPPHLFRPPYGSFNATTFQQARALGMLMVLWSTDTSDYKLPGVHAIVQSALAGAHPGAIILMHDGGGDRSQTIAALPAIVAALRRRGLRPVTVPQLLRDDPPAPGQPLPHSLAGD
jgi:peptidoglycan/xylan/chitin deacetylase (PgdA/CDA1 family)